MCMASALIEQIGTVRIETRGSSNHHAEDLHQLISKNAEVTMLPRRHFMDSSGRMPILRTHAHAGHENALSALNAASCIKT